MKIKCYERGTSVEPTLERNGLVFIDIGARKAELLRGHFFDENLGVREDRRICSVSSFKGCHMFLLEPDPHHFDDLCAAAEKASHTASSVTVICAGVWDSTGENTFYRSEGRASDYGSTLLPDKKNPYEPDFERLILEDPVTIQTIDILELLAGLKGEVFMKIDTEGGEYVILPRLLNSEVPKSLKGFFVEWHDAFYPERHREFERKYLDSMKALISMGVEYHWWPPEW
jgi:FkbM family methyltransferase